MRLVPAFVMRPLRGAVATFSALPSVVEAILVLPTLSRQLDEVRVHTASLPEMLEEIRHLHGDTQSLPQILDELERVQRNTLAVEQLAEVALPLQGAALRVGRFADRLPQRRAGGRLPPPPA